MPVVKGKLPSGFAEVIDGTPLDDTIYPMGGWDVVNGGSGVDTMVIAGNWANFRISANIELTYVDAISGASGSNDTTTLNSVERVQFDDVSVALDVGTMQASGQTALLLGAVLGQAALAAKLPLVGTVIHLFDQGFTLQQLSGAIMRLPIWDVLTGRTVYSNKDVATYLLTTVNGAAPDVALLATAVSALDSEIGGAQGDFLSHLAESAANQVQVDMVGLSATGLRFL